MDGPRELSLALTPPVDQLNIASPTTKAPPTTKGISTSWPGIGVSDFLFLPLLFPLLLGTVVPLLSFLFDKLLLPPFYLLQAPHLFCNGGHCESQKSQIQGNTWPPIASELRLVLANMCSWTAVVNISS